MREVNLRPATPDDVASIAALWDRGWHDAHDGHVPDALSVVRTPASFRVRTADRVAQTWVAVLGAPLNGVPGGMSGGMLEGEIAGFVVVHDDELEQVYVAADHRGTGVAQLLMAEGLRQVAATGHRRAWLAAAAGNARARRFYEREGWVDEGVVDYAAEGPDGPILVPNHRYVTPVAPASSRLD